MASGFSFKPEEVIFDVCNAETRKRVNGKGELSVVCPKKEKLFDVNLFKGGTWKCYHSCLDCPSDGHGGILDLYILHFPDCESRTIARERILKSLSGEIKIQKAPQERIIIPEKTETVKIATNEVIHDTYTEFLSLLPLTQKHYEDLKNRGLSDEDIKAVGFKSLPQSGVSSLIKSLVEKDCILSGVPGFYEKDGKPCVASWGSGYFIPYRDGSNNIVSLQIRQDLSVPETLSDKEKQALKKKRYRWFTSSGNNGGTQAKSVPFYGIPDRDKKEIVYATEGGLKAAVAQSLSDGWFVAIPGISTYTAWSETLSYLKDNGVKTIVDAFDSDRATNVNVDDSIKRLRAMAVEAGFEVKDWDWGTEYKGVDDYLLARKKNKKLK